ncbi:MAG: hypothetical protein EPN91_12885 [Salinibacterium sp.]|nr:MAG: hypothetical protein EPN91_12885 [Salinibacterium sp.]
MPEIITHTTNQLRLANGQMLSVPCWPKALHTKAELLAMVLEGCPHPRELHYIDLVDSHGAVAIH